MERWKEGVLKEKRIIIMTVNKAFRRPNFLIIYFLCTYNVEIEISVRDTNFNGIIRRILTIDAKQLKTWDKTSQKKWNLTTSSRQKKHTHTHTTRRKINIIIIIVILLFLLGKWCLCPIDESKSLSALSLQDKMEWWTKREKKRIKQEWDWTKNGRCELYKNDSQKWSETSSSSWCKSGNSEA